MAAPDEIDTPTAEVHGALLQATGETDELPYNVVQGPWLSPDDKEPLKE